MVWRQQFKGQIGADDGFALTVIQIEAGAGNHLAGLDEVVGEVVTTETEVAVQPRGLMALGPREGLGRVRQQQAEQQCRYQSGERDSVSDAGFQA